MEVPMCKKRAKLFAALFLSAGLTGICRGEIVSAAQADAVTPFNAITTDAVTVETLAFKTPFKAPVVKVSPAQHAVSEYSVSQPVAQFLNNSAVPGDLNRSPQEVLHDHPIVAPPVESQMVPLPPGVWTGMSGLLALGLVRAGRSVRKTFL